MFNKITKVICLLGILGIIFISIRSKSHHYDEINAKNKEIENSIDSMNLLLTIEKSKYDSLLRSIDSSKIRYDNINYKYKIIKDSIKYLNSDESIIFLTKMLSDE